MKKMDQVDHRVLGTDVSCILKSIAFNFNNHAYGCLLQRKVVLDDSTLRVPDETFLNIGLFY